MFAAPNGAARNSPNHKTDKIFDKKETIDALVFGMKGGNPERMRTS
jgi:hypothetical protein